MAGSIDRKPPEPPLGLAVGRAVGLPVGLPEGLPPGLPQGRPLGSVTPFSRRHSVNAAWGPALEPPPAACVVVVVVVVVVAAVSSPPPQPVTVTARAATAAAMDRYRKGDHPSLSSGASCRGAPRRGASGRGGHTGRRTRNTAPRPGSLSPDGAAVGLDEGGDDGQPEPGAAGPPAARGVGPVEPLEDPLGVARRRGPGPLVGDLDTAAIAARPPDAAPGPAVPGGVWRERVGRRGCR